MSRTQSEMKLDSKIAIVIPALNEEDGIGDTIDSIRLVLSGKQVQIVVVDGHSTDKTVEIALLRDALVIEQMKEGYGDALRTGFQYVYDELHADIIGMIDADGSYQPTDIPLLLDPILRDDADFVLGNRMRLMQKDAMTLTNRVGNKILSAVIRTLLGVNIRDTQSGFRMFRGELMGCLGMKSYGMPFATELIVEAEEAGARIKEVEVNYLPRKGKTKLNPVTDGFRIMATTIRLTRDYSPLLFFGSIASVFVALGMLIGISVVEEWLTTGVITRLASVVLSSLLLMMGVLSLSFGLLADMMSDLKAENRQRLKRKYVLARNTTSVQEQ